MSYRVSGAARFDAVRVLRHLHVNRAFQSKLTVFKHDRIFILPDSVDRAIESPVEDDAGRLAMETRIIFTLEVRGRLFSEIRQFGTVIAPRSCAGTALFAARPPALTARSPGLY